MANYSRLKTTSAATFSDMLNSFGIMTVMDARVYDYNELVDAGVFTKTTGYDATAQAILDKINDSDFSVKPLCEIKTLKNANVTQEGPTKTITGGQSSTPLVKFGKTARLEMQNALGNAEAIEALCGGFVEYSSHTTTGYSGRVGMNFGEDFASHKLIVGDTIFIDAATQQQVKANIIFYKFLPDSVFNLTQDAEGDATVFDMNGDLELQEIYMGTVGTAPESTGTDYTEVLESHKVFYSIVRPTTTTD